MIGYSNNNTEDIIVQILLNESKTAKQIKISLVERNKSISLTSLYEQIQKLIEKKIIIKTKKIYSINKEWLQHIREIFVAKNEYVVSNGEYIKHQTKGLGKAELFWKHVMHSLYSSYPNESVFIYNAHPFWDQVPGRKHSENDYFNYHEKNKRNGYYVLGGTTIHDINYRKEYSAQYFKIDLKNMNSFNRRDSITVIGDLIFTMSSSTSFAKHIDTIYETFTSPEKLKNEIATLCEHQWIINSKIEHNPKKALILKKRIARVFMSSEKVSNMFQN